MKIGFIGLGIMGKPMAKNLVADGHDLVVLDHNADNVGGSSRSAPRGPPPRARSRSRSTSCSPCCRTPRRCRRSSSARPASWRRPGTGCSTRTWFSIDPLVARDVSAALAERGVVMLDAPVSGGEPFAIEGTLSFMVGGPQEAFDVVQPVLAAMGKSVVRVGGIGAGNIAAWRTRPSSR